MKFCYERTKLCYICNREALINLVGTNIHLCEKCIVKVDEIKDDDMLFSEIDRLYSEYQNLSFS
jgi:hypothetical protein